MSIETLDKVKKFIEGDSTLSYEDWVIMGYQPGKNLVNKEGEMQYGLFNFEPKSLEDLLNHFCEKGDEKTATVIQLINLDKNTEEEPLTTVTNAIRTQIADVYGILVLSSSTERLSKARDAIAPDVHIVENFPVFLIDTKAIV